LRFTQVQLVYLLEKNKPHTRLVRFERIRNFCYE
jgi:hypothetical protein